MTQKPFTHLSLAPSASLVSCVLDQAIGVRHVKENVVAKSPLRNAIEGSIGQRSGRSCSLEHRPPDSAAHRVRAYVLQKNGFQYPGWNPAWRSDSHKNITCSDCLHLFLKLSNTPQAEQSSSPVPEGPRGVIHFWFPCMMVSMVASHDGQPMLSTKGHKDVSVECLRRSSS